MDTKNKMFLLVYIFGFKTCFLMILTEIFFVESVNDIFLPFYFKLYTYFTKPKPLIVGETRRYWDTFFQGWICLFVINLSYFFWCLLEDYLERSFYIQSFHWLNVLGSFGSENTGLSVCVSVCVCVCLCVCSR